MANLSRDSLIELITRLRNPQPGDSDEQIGEWVAEIEASVPDPRVSAYIFWDRDGLTPEQIVDRALSYRPIEL